MLKIHFTLKKATTNYGEEVFIVGSTECLGNWKIENSLRMNTDEKTYPVWELKDEILMECGFVEYKYVIRGNGNTTWEDGPNR